MSPLDNVDGCDEPVPMPRERGEIMAAFEMGLSISRDPYVPSQNKRATAPWSAGDRVEKVSFVFYPSELQRASEWQLEQQLLKMQKHIFF